MLDDCVHFRRIHEGALYTGDGGVAGIEAVSTTDELFRSLGIEHGTRVDDRLRAQGDARRDVRFDDTRDDVNGRTLGREDHVHTDRTGFLGDTRDRCLHLFAGLHDEVSILIDDDDDVRQVLVMEAVSYQFVRIQATTNELIVVVFEVAHACVHEQSVAVLHLDDEGVEGVDHAIAIGDNHLLGIRIGLCCQVVLEQRLVRSKLYHLRVHHDEFEFRRVLLVQQGSDDGVDRHGLTCTCCTRYEEMRGLGEVEHEDLVGNRSSVRDRQAHLVLVLEALGGDHRVHGNNLRFLVRHFDTDGTLTGHRGDDTDTGGRKRHHDVVLQTLDLRHTDTGFRHYFIERHGRADRCFDTINFYAIVAQGLHDTLSVIALFLFVDDGRGLVVVHFEQVETRELVEL